ncbi:MSMEG_1061 family FMN-dependent PPOX-type flavoprotein [Kordiimonas pumila]|uniref:MSMEG_1061 family FMN-dependent PPOX-type flavoprotein n=1 Tax=Kordiimonas pumila TaxID=2161677 RepID=A0ABV7D0Y0_9PROT|nr:MSMEG_1061 family FMN-dependent PPOX-type flavoprotein [Kordiimonas pumila]
MTDPYVIRSEDDLNKIYAPPDADIIAGIKTSLHEFHVNYIQNASFVCIGSAADNMFDVSPRGGEAGFIHVIDSKTIAIPDWRGNNKIETIRNIIRNGHVGLLFLFQGLNFFFRANGAAEVTTNPKLLAAMARDGKEPITAIRISINQIYLHCGKAVMRSKLWRESSHMKSKDLPSLAKMVKEFTKIEASEEAIEENNETMLRDRLY